MEDKINQLMITSLATKLINLELENAKKEAYCKILTDELQALNTVLDYDTTLKELFEEVRTTMNKENNNDNN